MRGKTAKLLRSIKATAPKLTPIATDMILPNLSGDHGSGRIRTTPTTDLKIANKKYVDDQITASKNTTEGTADKATGEEGDTKF